MSPAGTCAEILLPAAEVAALIGCSEHEVRALHNADFRVSGHWWVNSQDGVLYTERGLEGLVQVLTNAGRITAAAHLYSRLVMLRQGHDTPARALIGPCPMNSQLAPA